MSDALSNPDLAPATAEQRTWSMMNIAALWVGMAVCIPTYTLAASMISNGMSWWQAVMTVGLVRRAMAPGRVTMSRVLASLCAYLMIGLVWAEVYAAVAALSPGAFNVPQGWPQVGSGELVTMAVYFSYVTLTTLGYGDITPATETTRSLAVTEAIVGQLYLTVMVARLVGLFVAHEHSEVSD